MTNPRPGDKGPRLCRLKLLIAVLAVTGLHGAPESEAFLYRGYDEVLASYVDSGGRVDYGSLKEGRRELDLFVERLRGMDPAIWNPAAQIAFWINAYNALTLRVIIDNHPIQSSFLASLAYPKNSIRQIAGAWNKIQFEVAGRDRTLDEIEHSILRRQFDEPRIHVALVCAALGCPLLRREAYRGELLEHQLQDQAARFVRDRSRFRVDIGSGVVYLSSIFEWYGKDFEARYGAPPGLFPRHPAGVGAVLNFALPFLSEETRKFLQTQSFRVRYLSYDWTLNEQ